MDINEGQPVDTYDGLGVVIRKVKDAFYGDGKDGDGYRYDVRLLDGSVSHFDRSRIRPLPR